MLLWRNSEEFPRTSGTGRPSRFSRLMWRSSQSAASEISSNESEFILESASLGYRVDGRLANEYRNIRFLFGKTPGLVEVLLGKTRVMACVTGEIGAPSPDRPHEGSLFFNVEFTRLCSPDGFDNPSGSVSEQAAELNVLIERYIRESDAIDTETLCIILGKKVWNLRCDVRILDDNGNLLDSCMLASLAALRHFRRPDVTVTAGKFLKVHPMTERQAVPLNVNRFPITVTFGILPGAPAKMSSGSNERTMSKKYAGEDHSVHTKNLFLIADPNLKEELVCGGTLSIAVTAASESSLQDRIQELCGIHKAGGLALTSTQVQDCIELACLHAENLTNALQQAVAQDLQSKIEAITPRYPERKPVQ